MKKIYILLLLSAGILIWADAIAQAPYCTPAYTTGCTSGDGLTLFQLNSIKQTIACDGSPNTWYHDYTATTTSLLINGSNQFVVTPGANNTYVAAWIDFNDDNVFDPVTELMEVVSCPLAGSMYVTTFNLPSGSTPGTHRLRFRTNTGSVPSDACSSLVYGNSADFTVFVSDPLTGTKSVPGDYPTIAGAIASLNVLGVGTGGVTFNIAAGYTETFASPTAGYITTNTGTLSNQIIFQRSGTGANPLITAPTGIGTMDAIICFKGVSYITFDGIDLRENPANTNGTTWMEWGYALLKSVTIPASVVQGSQYNTIKNCTITLNKANVGNTSGTYYSCGIYSNNHTTASITQLSVTAVSGQNSNNKFYGNTIQNCNSGMYIYGYNASSPYTYYDQNNDIGSVAGNTIQNYGSSASVGSYGYPYGIYANYQNGLQIANNNITSGSGITVYVYGIYTPSGTYSSISIYGNTVTHTGAGPTYGMYGIYNGMGSLTTGNIISIHDNNVVNCSYPSATSAIFYGIYNSGTATTMNINGNLVDHNIIGGSATTYLLYSSSSSGSTLNVYNNTISNNQRNGSGYNGSTTLYCLDLSVSGITSIHDNQVFSNSVPNISGSYSASIYSIYATSSSTQQTIYNNVIHDQTIGGTNTTSNTIYGIYHSTSSTGSHSVYNNTIFNLSYTGSSTGYCSGYGVYSGGGTNTDIYNNKVYGISLTGTSSMYSGMIIASGTTVNVYNNYIYDIKTTASTRVTGAIYGINVANPTYVNLYYNTVYLNATSTSSTTFGTSGVIASTSPTLDMRNNIIINTSSCTGSGYLTVAYQRNSTTLTTYAATSNNNDLYAGTPSATNLIYYDPSNSIQTLAAYKTLVSPRDAASITEMPPFVSTAPTYNLHLQTSVPTDCESGGTMVSTPISITTDWDGNQRYPNTGYPDNPGYAAGNPDIGADEFGGTGNTPVIHVAGTFTIPGTTYPTIASTINAINTYGVGIGGVTFNVNAGYAETFTSSTAGYITTNTTSATMQVIFQKSGIGANPLITAPAGAGTRDAIICFNGVRYVTFDGIDLQENSANTNGTTRMEWGYALLKLSGTQGSQYNTIKNCTITLNAANVGNTSGTCYSCGIYANNHTTSSITQLTVITASGQNSNNKFYGNTIQNCNGGIYLYGYNASSPYTYYDQNNDIGSVTGNTIQNYGSSASAGSYGYPYGIYANYQNGLLIANNYLTCGTGITTNVYGIYTGTGTSSGISFSGNVVTLTCAGTTGSMYGIYNGIGSTPAGNTVTINNNSVKNCTYSSATSAVFYGIYNAGTAATININGNRLDNNVIGGSANLYLLYSTSATGSTVNVYNDTVSNNQRTGGYNGSTTMYCFSIEGGTAVSSSIHDNQIFNNSVSGLSGSNGATIYSLSPMLISTTGSVYNNIIHDQSITGSNTSYVHMYGIYQYRTAGTGNYNVYNNTIYNLSYTGSSTGYGYGEGVFTINGATTNIYNNKIYGMILTGTGAEGTGIYIGSGSTVNVYNNYIYDINTPSSTSLYAVNGIYINSPNTCNLYYNTIFLNAVSSSTTTFGTAGVYAYTTPSLDMRNNIIINTSSCAGGGYLTVAYQRNTADLTTYAATSNNNDLYAGTPSATNLIYQDTWFSVQTLAEYQTRVSPRDAVSITEMPPFVSPAAPYDLHINTTVPTFCESGGTIVSSPVSITTDQDGDARYPNPGFPDNISSPAIAPDIGADEFDGLRQDNIPPAIVFTPFLNTSSTAPRTLTTTISDASGVPVTDPGLPRLYWKKFAAGSWNSAIAVHGTGSTYTFTFGGGLMLNDSVYYYVVAQDTPPAYLSINVTSNPPGGSGYTANPPACSTPPPASSLYAYKIVGTICGTFDVGVASPYYTTLTAAIADLNNKEITCPVTFILTDAAYSSETFPIIINTNAGSSATNTVTIKPATGVSPVISGSSATTLLKFNQASYMTIDGSNSGGTDQSLTFSNTITSGNNAVIWVGSNGTGAGSDFITVKNCNIANGYNSSDPGRVCWGVIAGSGSTLGDAGDDNDNLTLQNNSVSKAFIGIWAEANATGLLDNLQIVGNTVGSSAAGSYIGQGGIIVASATGALISGNTVFNILTNVNNPVGITISTGVVSSVISKNSIHDISYYGNSGWGTYGLYISTGNTASNLTIANNLIYRIQGYGDSYIYWSLIGMYTDQTTGGLNIWDNSVYMNGNLTNNVATLTAAVLLYSSINNDMRNNIFMNSMVNTMNTSSKNYAIYITAFSYYFPHNDYNDYFPGGTQGVLGYISGTDKNTLADWRATTGQEVHSISADPLFNSTNNLRPLPGSPVVAAGTPLAGISDDYTGYPRSLISPSIGAYEQGLDVTPPLVSYTPLPNTLSLTQQTLTTNITDISGVPITGSGLPALYWKINKAGSWNVYTASYGGGNTYTFTFGAGVSSGDTVFYYIAAQDNATIINVGASPSAGASGPSYNPPAFSTPPASPNYYVIMQYIPGGDFRIGGTGTTPAPGCTFVDLTAAFNYLAAKYLSGPVTLILTSYYNSAEEDAFPVTINPLYGASLANTIIIKPDAGVTTAIAGTSLSSVLKLSAAAYVTIDGSNNGTASRDLSIINNSTAGNTASVWIASQGTGAGTNHVTIRNCNIANGFNTQGSYGIFAGSASAIGTSGDDNDNLTLQNNNISKAYIGIWTQANATGLLDNLQVVGNSVGSSTADNYIGHNGIMVAYATGALITQNTIFNIITSAHTPVGMTISTGVVNSVISKNNINNITYTGSDNWGPWGIYVNTGNAASNLTFANNVIGVIGGDGYYYFYDSSPVGMYFDGVTGGLNIYYNSVYMSGNLTYSGGTITTAILFYTSTITNIDLRNNIFMNSIVNTMNTSAKNYDIYSSSPAASFTQIDYNDYFPSGTQSVLGYMGGADKLTLTAWRTATGKDVHSLSVDPQFFTTTDLHTLRPELDHTGIAISGITTDFSGITRFDPPDIGAYEQPQATSLPATSILQGSAYLNGIINACNQSGNASFEYGKTLLYGTTVSATPGTVSGTSNTAVTANITGLDPYSTYHFRTRFNPGSVWYYGADQVFNTPALPLVGNVVVDNMVSCQGLSDGRVTVSATGGVTPYQFRINSGAYQGSGTFTGLAIGSYTATVKDAVNSTTDVPFTMTQSYFGPKARFGTIPPTCPGGQLCIPVQGVDLITGSSEVCAISLKFTFDHTKMTYAGVIYNDGTNPGQVPWTDHVGYGYNNLHVMPDPGNPDVIRIGGTGQSFGFPGTQGTFVTICFNYLGGNTALTWDDSGNGGTECEFAHFVTGQGCVKYCDLPYDHYYFNSSVNGPLFALSGGLTGQVDISCNGGSEGRATISGTGGTSPYNYALNPGGYTGGPVSGSFTFTGLSAGTYTWSITDAHSCGPATGTVTITQPAGITLVSATTQEPSCYGGNGTITLVCSGGTAPLQYTIGTETNTTGSFLRPYGTYSYSVNDVHSCGPVTGSVSVGQPSQVTAVAGNNGPVCQDGLSYITVSVSAGGGVPGPGIPPLYHYSWLDPHGLTAYPDASSLLLPADSLLYSGTWYVTVTDSHGCTGTSSTSAVINRQHNITGTLKYNDDVHTFMKNVGLTLMQGSSTMSSATTADATGYYHFDNVCPGDYRIVVTSNPYLAGSLNATDAVQVSTWFMNGNFQIEHVRFLAGDVYWQSNYGMQPWWINSTDVLRIQMYFVFNGTQATNYDYFDRPPWSYWFAGEYVWSNTNPGVTTDDMTVHLGGVDKNIPLYAQCTGDFNSSYTPDNSKEVPAKVQLSYGITRQAGAESEVELPVYMVYPAKVGAASLVLNYPSDLVEVKDVIMNGAGGNLDWTTNGNELRIGWHSMNPLVLGADDDLLVLRLKTSGNFTEGKTIRFTIVPNPMNELADDMFNPVPETILGIDLIEALKTATPGILSNEDLTLENHPNPFSNSTLISYLLPNGGIVTLVIHNLMGEVVKTILSEYRIKGDNTLKMNSEFLAPGVYALTLNLESNGQKFSRTIKLVKTR
ncbi:MAG: GEVED domain-containing protein [Bacteroidetes bacterium]|nr:GEVED domain-containing protein [Bacteroidota bacterium]